MDQTEVVLCVKTLLHLQNAGTLDNIYLFVQPFHLLTLKQKGIQHEEWLHGEDPAEQGDCHAVIQMQAV